MSAGPAATLLARDELALMMMREYSALCAACAHEPSAARFAAADEKREAILRHAAQQERAISAAIDRLVLAARVAGRITIDDTEWAANQQTQRDREAELRALLGVS